MVKSEYGVSEDSDLEAPASDSEASTQDTHRASEFMKDVDLHGNGGKAMQAYLDQLGTEAWPCEANVEQHSFGRVLKGTKPQVAVYEKESNQQVRKLLAQELNAKKAEDKLSCFVELPIVRDLQDAASDLCMQCHLPIGDQWYKGNDGIGMYHAECMAQKLLKEMRDEEVARKQEVIESRAALRADYDIGWDVKSVPFNAGPAEKLVCRPVPEGLCCLVLGESSIGERCVQLAATADPAASVNLEYLSTALEVRRSEGREPLFSLEPVDPNDKKTMQAKRFEPEWIAGTSLGEVMFQADYNLKELSMGECEQPVLGMRSCLDYSQEEARKDWYAREWFTVKDAEMRVSARNVLTPHVKMGVEAREQILTAHGLDDVVLTRKDHPMVKYAENFTNYFDLIAERKSVVFHLREVAKASVLAKYLIDSQVSLGETWFCLAGDRQQVCPMEVPQLWNQQVYSQIHVKDGAIVDGDKGIGSSMRGIYGGIRFGLDRFTFGTMPGATMAKPAQVGAYSRLKPSPAVMPGPPSTRPTAGLSPAPPFMAMGLSAGTAAMSRAGAAYEPITTMMTRATQPKPQGVDLNLDSFNLSELKHASHEMPEGSWEGEFQSLDYCANMGCDFWAILDHGKGLSKGHQNLLEAIFNPHLSDRRAEGDRFVPPNPSPEYMQKLRKLVKNEELLQQKRRDHFCSKAFATGDPSDLFPTSWTSTFAMSNGEVPVKVSERHAPERLLQHRLDYEAEAHTLKDSLKSIVPAFDKSTEVATRYRIYRLGSVEVRTVQEQLFDEEVVAVFSVRTQKQASVVGKKHELVDELQKVAKATEYVQAAGASCTYFVVLDTESGQSILTEMFEDGRAAWEESPEGLEDRISLAKVLRATDCSEKGNTVRDLKMHMKQEAEHPDRSKREAVVKAYSRSIFSRACCQRSDIGMTSTMKSADKSFQGKEAMSTQKPSAMGPSPRKMPPGSIQTAGDSARSTLLASCQARSYKQAMPKMGNFNLMSLGMVPPTSR